MAITWESDLNTGIDVIDKQHKRIVDFINQLEFAVKTGHKELVKEVIDDCVDYTLSHFAFEESLMEEVGYNFSKPHKKVHELFTRKIGEYQTRMAMGEDIADELHGMLERWLVNHIKRDDADYAFTVKENMIKASKKIEHHESKGWFKRLFGG